MDRWIERERERYLEIKYNLDQFKFESTLDPFNLIGIL